MILCAIAGLAGCAPFEPHLSFPTAPIKSTPTETWYDANHDGKPDFALHYNAADRVDSLLYDDNEDGAPDRIYRLADYANQSVPHLIILLDSIPYQMLADRYAAGDFRWFNPPAKVIPPFPSLTELCYTRVLHAPPLAGMTDEYYDPAAREIHDGFWQRATGYREPWERCLAYNAHYMEASFTYLDPRDWLPVEMARMKEALDKSPDHVTIVYAVTASGMACKYGAAGINQTLDAARQLCLQLLYERHGAIKLSMMADHGHNLTPSHSASPQLKRALEHAGFHITDSLRHQRNVVIELAALVDYIGLRTTDAPAVAQAATRAREVEFATYLQGPSVIIRDARGCAAIDCRDGDFRYRPINRDVLHYQPILDRLRASGELTPDGFASDADWFAATLDAQYPDAPRRLWDAFHDLVVNPPEVMLTLHNGYYAGKASLQEFITMRSTHGSLDQQNSATFLLTMTHPTTQPLRSDQVLNAIEPGFKPHIRK